MVNVVFVQCSSVYVKVIMGHINENTAHSCAETTAAFKVDDLLLNDSAVAHFWAFDFCQIVC